MSGARTGSRLEVDARSAMAFLAFQRPGRTRSRPGFAEFAGPTAAATLMGYPSEEILNRHVAATAATVLALRGERSAGLAAVIFQEAAGVVQDPLWRTFMKWKHGIAVTSPGAAPLWLPETPELNVDRTETRLKTAIVVFDARDEPSIYVWPAERTDFILYSTFASQVLDLSRALLGSVLGYARLGLPALQWFEIDEDQLPDSEELAALDRCQSSPFPTAALAGQWR